MGDPLLRAILATLDPTARIATLHALVTFWRAVRDLAGGGDLAGNGAEKALDAGFARRGSVFAACVCSWWDHGPENAVHCARARTGPGSWSIAEGVGNVARDALNDLDALLRLAGGAPIAPPSPRPPAPTPPPPVKPRRRGRRGGRGARRG